MSAERTVATGVDVGGSGVKGARVDVAAGTLVRATPRPATPEPEAVAGVAATGPVGSALPAVVQHGVVRTAANIDRSWIGVDAAGLIARRLGRPVTVLNDADAAGIAEISVGAGRGRNVTVLLVTLGTGIGSAVFVDGTPAPNTELGHLELRGLDADNRRADSVCERDELSSKKWVGRLERCRGELEDLLWPDLFIVGGGVGKEADRLLPRIETRAELVPARLPNDADVVGAALAAEAA